MSRFGGINVEKTVWLFLLMMGVFKDALEILQKTDATETPDVYRVQSDSENRMPEGGTRKV